MAKDNMPKFIGSKDWDRKPKTRKFVITGCNKSGLLYMTKVFNILGFTVGYECILKNGTSSWYITERSHSSYIKSIFKGHAVTYIHIIKHPFEVIRSIWLYELLKDEPTLDFMRIYYPKWNIEYDLNSIAYSWMFWNMETATNFPINITLPIEQLQFPDSFAYFCHLLKIKYYPKYFRRVKELRNKTTNIQNMNENSLKKLYEKEILKPITFDEIIDGDNELANKLKTFAKNYGYEIG